MEEKIQARASLGSKLPKFGASKPLGSFLQRPPNGTQINLSGTSNISSRDNKHNDLEQGPSFSLSWRKIKSPQNDKVVKEPTHSSIGKGRDGKIYSQFQVTADKPTPRAGVTSKNGKESTMVVSHKEDLNENLLPGLPTPSKFTKSTALGRTSYSGLNGCKTQLNGFYNLKPSTGLQRPRANSATTRNFSNKVLASSTDNVKNFSYVRRSQSFSHSIQNSVLPSTPLARSHSFNREVDLTRSYETQHIHNTRTAPKSHLLSRSDRQYDLPNGNAPQGKSGFTRTYSAGSTSGLKKPSLSNGTVLNNIPLGYKMSRPSMLKSTKSQYPRDGAKCSSFGSSITEKTKPTPNGIVRTTDKDVKTEENVSATENYSLFDDLEKLDYYGEDLDELSISSLSSSDKNDLSEDFSDDFIDLEDGNKTILEVEPDGKVTEKLPAEDILSSLQDSKKCIADKTDAWIGMNITVQNVVESTGSPFGDNRISPDMEYRDPSSLELSPSDSSGGTYMWDEEGMEPIGSVHPCGSFDSSEMNSLDILNNLDSCDLEEDDLMLDVDLPEDTPCEIGKGENMNHFERTDRNLRQHQQGFWKRPPQRLFGQEQYHLINTEHYLHGRGSACLESPTDHRESYGSPNFFPQSPRTPQIMVLRENTVMLDEMTLRHMVQDCTAVKTQLLKLKRFLQQEDESGSAQDIPLSVPSTPEPQEPEPLFKTEDLLNEIRQLKEESKKKDEAIRQLEHQLTTRCKCQQEIKDTKVEKTTRHDKYTQTNWRRSSPPVLQYSSNIPSSTDPSSGKLIKPPHIEDPSKPENVILQPSSHAPTEESDNDSIIFENELSSLLSKKLKMKDLEHNLEEQASNPGSLNGGLKPETLQLSLSIGQKGDQQSKVTHKASPSAGQIPRPKTLQLYKPKTQTTSAHKELTNSVTTNRDLHVQTMASSPSLEETSNGSLPVVQKSQQSLPNDCPVGQPEVHATSHSLSRALKPVCTLKDQTLSVNKSGTRQSIQQPSPSYGSSKSPSSLPVESSKQTSKQPTQSSTLRPPSNFAFKLKKPNISKPETVQPSVVTQETTKSQLKPPTLPSALPKPTSHKALQESGESSIPKRHSRLPQPKTH